MLVSYADKLHNARAILADLREQGDRVWERFNPTGEQSLWYYRSLCDVFKAGDIQLRLKDELERTVSEMEALAD